MLESKLSLSSLLKFGKTKARPKKVEENTNKEAQSEEAKNEKVRNERARSEKAQNKKSEYEIKVEGFLQQCKIFRNFLGGLNSDTTYGAIQEKFEGLFGDYINKVKNKSSRTSKILNEMNNKLSKYHGYFDPERVGNYGDIFKFKAKKAVLGLIKRSAIDDAEVADIFNKKIPETLGIRGKEVINEVKEFNFNTEKDLEKAEFFKDYIKKVTIGDNIKEISPGAFSEFTVLKEINLKNVTKIGANAFDGCSSLEEIDLSSIKDAESIGENAFKDSGLRYVNSLNGDKLAIQKKIREQAGDKVAFIEHSTVLTDTSDLTKCTNNIIVNKKEDLEKVLKFKNDIIKVVIGDGIEEIGEKVFSGCKKLGIVELGKNCTKIGTLAFFDCFALKSINLGDVTSIGASAFYGCKNLKKVDLSKVIQIGSSAFSYCEKLQTVDLSKVTQIGSSAFSHCEKLQTVDLSKVTQIGWRAFEGCKNLNGINLSSVETISSEAFNGCESLMEVDLSSIKNAESIEMGAFGGCRALRSVVLPTAQKGDENDENRINEIKKKICLQVNGEDDDTGDITFKEKGSSSKVKEEYPTFLQDYGAVFTVKTKKDFRKVSNLDEDGKKVSEFKNGFGEVKKLKEGIQKVIIGDKIKAIVYNAFTRCILLKIVELGKNCKKIGNSAFFGCGKLTEIDLSEVETIGVSAFSGCTELRKVDSNKVTKIGDNAFYCCQKLQKIYLDSIENADAIGTDAFTGCKALKTIILPEAKKDDKNDADRIEAIRKKIYEQINKKVEPKIDSTDDPVPKVDTTQKEHPTISQTKKESPKRITYTVEKENSLIIAMGYSQRGRLQKLIIKCDKIKEIGSSAFLNGTLEEADLGNATGIQAYAFSNCKKLKKVTLSSDKNINIGIDKDAFSGCTNLTEINLNNVTTIDVGAFSDCTSLTEVDLSKATKIGDGAFYGCTGLQKVNLSGITNADAIGNYSFIGCNKLDSVILPEAKKGNKNDADRIEAIKKKICLQVNGNETNDNGITFINDPGPGVNTEQKEMSEGTTFIVKTEEDFKKFSEVKDKIRKVIIGGNIQQIGEGAFSGCTSLTEVDVSNVSTISGYAFSGCTSLQKINLSNVTDIMGYAFYNCASLTEINLSNIGTIYKHVFDYCTSLTEVNLSNVRAIASYVFEDCINLQKVNLDEVAEISMAAFYGCTVLTEVNLSNVTEIDNVAFCKCTMLNTINLSGVTKIGAYAFYGCEKLNTINLSSIKNVKSIGAYAFTGSKLSSVILPKEADKSVIEAIKKKICLQVNGNEKNDSGITFK